MKAACSVTPASRAPSMRREAGSDGEILHQRQGRRVKATLRRRGEIRPPFGVRERFWGSQRFYISSPRRTPGRAFSDSPRRPDNFRTNASSGNSFLVDLREPASRLASELVKTPSQQTPQPNDARPS